MISVNGPQRKLKRSLSIPPEKTLGAYFYPNVNAYINTNYERAYIDCAAKLKVLCNCLNSIGGRFYTYCGADFQQQLCNGGSSAGAANGDAPSSIRRAKFPDQLLVGSTTAQRKVVTISN